MMTWDDEDFAPERKWEPIPEWLCWWLVGSIAIILAALILGSIAGGGCHG